MQRGHRQKEFPGVGNNLQPLQHQSSPEAERSSWTNCTARLLQDLPCKEELRVEWRRADYSELSIERDLHSSFVCLQFSPSDILVLVTLEAWALIIHLETSRCLGLLSHNQEAGFAG